MPVLGGFLSRRGPAPGRAGRLAGRWVVVATAVLVLGLGGCGQPLRFAAADGEIGIYHLMDHAAGVAVGQVTYMLEDVDGNWSIRQELSLGRTRETVELTVAAGTLRPRQLGLEVTTPDGWTRLDATYTGRTAEVKLDRQGEIEAHALPLPRGRFFEGESLLYVLRSLPLATGYRTQLEVVLTRSLTPARIGVEVRGREQIRTPAGEFLTWVVEVPDLFQMVWIGVEAPHPVVRVMDWGSGTALELVAFQASW